MLCRHCGEETNLNEILCDFCVQKALQVLPTNPEERIPIYDILMQSENLVIRLCAEQLLKQDITTIEERELDKGIDETRES
jgi:hypothetical protein